MTDVVEKHFCSCGVELPPIVRGGLEPIHPSSCDDCIEKDRAESREAEKLRLQEWKKERDRRLYGSKAFEEFTMEKFNNTGKHGGARGFLSSWSPLADNAYLHGACGTGKTHLAIGAYRLCDMSSVDRGVGYLTWPSLNRRFRALRAEKEVELLNETARCSPLLIDDLAAGRSSEFTCDIFLQILNIRIQEGVNGLIVTSNLSLSDLASKLQDDRISSRLAGLCQVFRMEGADERMRSPKKLMETLKGK